MKKHIWMSIVVLAIVAGAGWAAPTPSLPVTMQAVGTFDTVQPAAKITMTASADESEPASFTVKSAKPVSGLWFKLAGDFVSGKNQIPAKSAVISAVDGDNLIPVEPSDLQPGETKRFWMTINVPARAVAGMYQSAVVAVAGGKMVGKLPIELDILPMRLLKSSKQYGVMLRHEAGVDEGYKTLLSNLRASGLVMVSSAAPAESLGDALKAIKSAGLSAPVPYLCYLPDAAAASAVEEQARSVGMRRRLLYNTACEPVTPEEIECAAARVEMLKQARLKSFAVINDGAAFDQLAPSLDALASHIDTPYMQGLVSGEKRSGNRNEWWYWDVAGDPKTNRLYAGWFLWKAALDGALPALPCADSAGAFLNTIQWEAFREGMDDTRYATTLMSASREVKDALKVSGTKNATLAQKTSDETDTYLSAVFVKPLKDLSNSDYQTIRLKMAQHTIALRKMLK